MVKVTEERRAPLFLTREEYHRLIEMADELGYDKEGRFVGVDWRTMNDRGYQASRDRFSFTVNSIIQERLKN